MRRPIAAVGLSAIGLWLILSYKSSPLPRAASSLSATGPTTSVPGEPGSTRPPAAGPPGPTRGTAAPPITRTITGEDVPNQFGDVQVAIVLRGTRIVDVRALQLPFDRARSKYISDRVAPYLRTEVLDAQSAQIDSIGGATYTSESYAESVQSALDKAHA
jgi:hypothetical protein